MHSHTVRIKERSLVARIAAYKLGTRSVAVVVGHTIHLHGVSREAFLCREAWLCHELRHVAQYEQYGIAGFLSRYFIESLRRGYYNNRLETEARASENDRSLLEQYPIAPAEK